MTNELKISIITLTSESAREITGTLESINQSDYDNLEVVFKDNYSKDATVKMIKNICIKENTLISTRDCGIYDGLNNALGHANGDVIGLLHSGDVFVSNDVINTIMGHFNLDENLEIVWGDVRFSKLDENSSRRKIVRSWRSSHYKPRSLHYGWMPPHTSVFVRKTFLNKNNLFYDKQYKISGDYDWIIRLFKVCKKSKYIPIYITDMRLGGASNGSIAKQFKKFMEDYSILKKHEFRYPFFTACIKRARKIKQYFK